MLDYNLENRGEASLYEYVYQQIRDDIVAGLWLRGISTEMPSLLVPARMMSTDRSSDLMRFLLPLWRRRGFGKVRYGRR